MPRTRRKIVFEEDPEPDFSWLQQEMYNPSSPEYAGPIYPTTQDMRKKQNAYDPEWYRDPANHVALSMLVYELGPDDDDWRLVDSLGNIDFLDDGDDHGTGTFYRVEQIPKGWTYQRHLAREARLPSRKARRERAARPIIHFATKDTGERLEMGEAICKAGYASRTEHEQYVNGDYAAVTCRRCIAVVKKANRDEENACRQTACRYCGLDIEQLRPFKKTGWHDRGGNSRCNDDKHYHAPVREA